MDWHALFRFDQALELVVRGTAVYWFLFLLFRLVLRRDVGALGIADVLVVVLIADAAQNAMAGSYDTITDGFVLVSTIAAWNYLMDWAGYHFPSLRKFLQPGPLKLVKDGQLQRRNMRQELVSPDELMAQLRAHGIEDVSQVKSACMEADGSISVIRADGQQAEKSESGLGRTL